MPASRIFALPRTMRWATVDGVVSKALAISSVVKPHTSRNVKATCVFCGKAGWQHVKINRRRSSSMSWSTGSASCLPLPRGDAPRLARTASSRARRRTASIPLNRPVETSHAGVVGSPLARPLFDGRGKRLLKRLLGQIKVAEQADQGCQHVTRLGPIDLAEERFLTSCAIAWATSLCRLRMSHFSLVRFCPEVLVGFGEDQ